MNVSFDGILNALKESKTVSFIPGIKRGIEKESLRVNKNGFIAETPHPKELGASLTHPLITTDYSEALLEFITPPTDNISLMFQTLKEIHQYVDYILKMENQGEYLWTSSMPCRLPEENKIPIAEFGRSNLGQLKNIYRKGLGLRYGRRMQTIAGIHYNFSLPDNFWQAYQQLKNSNQLFRDFVSDQYLSMIRNGLRYSWLIIFLFGAAPALCASFLKIKRSDLELIDDNTLVGQHATSLRLSDLGYHNKTQSVNDISYNSLAEYLKTIKQAINTVEPEFEKWGVQNNNEMQQLSACRLQSEDEHYTLLRPKRITGHDERMITMMAHQGIEYIEFRIFDINPFLPLGIDTEVVYLADIFLMYCLLKESPFITKEEEEIIHENQKQVANYGRKPGLLIKRTTGFEVSLLEYATELLTEFKPVAKILDAAYNTQHYSDSLNRASQKMKNFHTLPSAQIIAEMQTKHESYFDFAKRWSLFHQKELSSEPIDKKVLEKFLKTRDDSYTEQKILEESDRLSFSEYLSNFLKS